MSVLALLEDIRPGHPAAARDAAASRLRKILVYCRRKQMGRQPTLYEPIEEDEDVQLALLKLIQRMTSGRGLPHSVTSDGQCIKYFKTMLYRQALNRAAERAARPSRPVGEDGEQGEVDPPAPEPDEELMDGLSPELRRLVTEAVADRDPERALVCTVLGSAVARARRALRVDYRREFDRSWRELRALNFDEADPIELMRASGEPRLDTPDGLKQARDRRTQAHMGCRNKLAAASTALRDEKTWDDHRLALALVCIRTLKRSQ